jgi:multidrug resistance protein, MATE family
VQATCQGALRGLGDVQYPTLICAVSYWIFGLPFGYVLAKYFGYGVYGIWFGLCTGLFIASILLLYRFIVASKPAAVAERNIDPSLVLAH